MVSLSYRSLANFINEDNLYGLQSFLESRKVQVDDRDENGGTALIVATSKGKLNFVRELLEHGADVNAEDFDNWTALLCAAKEGYRDICAELLDHGADINRRDMGSWTPLMWSIYKNRVDTAVLLMERGADINAQGNFHVTSLMWAAGRGRLELVRELLQHGAKYNVGDKYGTTALVWACRKGHTEIVQLLLKAGANVDTAGMFSWTSLLVAAKGNYIDIVNLLLQHRPNVNAIDKDGCTALTIACKEGYHEIATALLSSGAYVNLQDRSGDTNLIHASKAGHRSVVEALLKKYADVDVQGKDKKTPLYWAVEKNNLGCVKLLLMANPDVELYTKDGDTALMRAVRSRNVETVQLLLDKKAKVSATDKNGDTALHIAMRARSKTIVEVLLRNPKNSQLLYRPNKAGETPYNIDMSYQKPILGQIFGARRLNTNEDNENVLGYDLYSSALADILSEPSLSMPITVGLYAKWGSGKSFLLNKLRDEMKNFARRWVDPMFNFSFLLFVIVFVIALLFGIICGLSSQLWYVGLAVGAGTFLLIYLFLFIIWHGSRRHDWNWAYSVNIYLAKQLKSTRLVLQVMFCNPPGSQWNEGSQAQPISFYFTDQTKVNNAAGCENSVSQMVGSLYDAIENDYGVMCTRLYRAFRPKPVKATSPWRWRRLCCMPYFVIFIFCFVSTLIGIIVLTMYLTKNMNEEIRESTGLLAVLIAMVLLVGIIGIANLYTLGQVVQSLMFSHRRHLQRTVARHDFIKAEGYLQALKAEVNLMVDMVKCLDAFAHQQTRLVVIVDGLDSCEQDKVLHVLDAINVLFSEPKVPFIIVWNIDPHKIAKVLEQNLTSYVDSNIGAHDYLRNAVHLPFYLQNSGLRKAKVAQQTALTCRKSMTAWTETEDSVANMASLAGQLSPRRSSVESNFGAYERPSIMSKKGKKLKLSESIASSLGSNLNRAGGANELTKMLLTDDYFSDVNPRSMRRLMNVVYITGRLLKAFHIDFNWYRLASWVNITEQWPFRTSCIILYFESCEDCLEDTMPLKSVYDKIRPQIPVSKDGDSLVDMDRDEKKFDIFLSFHKNTLLIADLKIFLPFTINLDPHIRKTIKEEQQNLEEMGIVITAPPSVPQTPMPLNVPWASQQWSERSNLVRRHPQANKLPMSNRASTMSYSDASAYTNPMMMWPMYGGMSPYDDPRVTQQRQQGVDSTFSLPQELLDKKLSTLTVDGICELIRSLEGFQSHMIDRYCNTVHENNISGRVLTFCELDELKKVIHMTFGDWELFRMAIASLREQERNMCLIADDGGVKNVRFTVPGLSATDVPSSSSGSSSGERRTADAESKGLLRGNKSVHGKISHADSTRRSSRQNVLEKQVTLEEQMIIGALQTLNEEAFEDTLNKDNVNQAECVNEGPCPSTTTLSPIQSDPDEMNVDSPAAEIPSLETKGEVGFVYLHTSPMHEVSTHYSGEFNLAGSLPSVHVEAGIVPFQHVDATTAKPPLPPPNSIRGSTQNLNRTGSTRSISGAKPDQPRSALPKRPSSLHVSDEPGVSAEWIGKTPPMSPARRRERRTVSISEERAQESIENSPNTRRTLLHSLDIGSSIEKLHKFKQHFLQSVTQVKNRQQAGADSDDSGADEGEETPLVSVSSSPSKVTVSATSAIHGSESESGSATYTSAVSTPAAVEEGKATPQTPPSPNLMRQDALDPDSREQTPALQASSSSDGKATDPKYGSEYDPETTV